MSDLRDICLAALDACEPIDFNNLEPLRLELLTRALPLGKPGEYVHVHVGHDTAWGLPRIWYHVTIGDKTGMYGRERTGWRQYEKTCDLTKGKVE